MRRSVNPMRGQGLPVLPLAVAAILAVLLVGGYLMYDFGLSRAGYLRAVTAEEIEALEAEAAALRSDNKALSERVAVLETAALMDREAYRQVEAELVELQSRILEQQEDIEFYRGIIGEDDGSQLRMQDFRIVSLTDGDYELRLVLAQALRGTRGVSGTIDIAVEGVGTAGEALLALADLSPEEMPLRYDFRYFQELRVRFALPEGFKPGRLRVTVRPQGKSAETVEEFFVWQPQAG